MTKVKLWSSKRTADYLGIEDQTLRKWRVKGKGPQYIKTEGAVRYLSNVVKQYRQACTRSSTSDDGQHG